jgi:hypothetical protein
MAPFLVQFTLSHIRTRCVNNRGADLYFMLAEALNNLVRTKPAALLVNSVVNGAYMPSDPQQTGFTPDWTSNTTIGCRSLFSFESASEYKGWV